MSLWRHDQRPLWQHCEDLLNQIPESTAYHFEGALRAVASQIAAAMEHARLVPGVTLPGVAWVIMTRMRAGDRAACTTVIRRAIPAAGARRRPVVAAAGMLAAAAIVVIAQSSLAAAVIAAIALSIGTAAVWSFGSEVFVVMFRLATHRELRLASVFRNEVCALAAAGDLTAVSRYDELSALAVGDPIADWIRSEALEALAAMNDDVAQRRAFAEVRSIIEADAVAPVADKALARALVSLTPQFPGTAPLIERLFVISPGVCAAASFARDQISERLRVERVRAER